jgi:hypothetical protein
MPRYVFDEVRAALQQHWGLSLYRGGELTDLGRDGRWDVTYSKTGYVIGGQWPRGGHGYRRFSSLGSVVKSFELAKIIEEQHRG